MTEQYQYQTRNIYQRIDDPFGFNAIPPLCSMLLAAFLICAIGPDIARANQISEDIVYAAIVILSLLMGFIFISIYSYLQGKTLKSEKFRNETKQLLFDRFSGICFDIAVAHFDNFANKHPKDSEFQTLYGQYLSHIATNNQSQNAGDDFYRLHRYVECFDENKYRAAEKLRTMNFVPIKDSI